MKLSGYPLASGITRFSMAAKRRIVRRSFGGIQFTYQQGRWTSSDGIVLICYRAFTQPLAVNWEVQRNPRSGKTAGGINPEDALANAGIIGRIVTRSGKSDHHR
jgi:hypothetical protein